MEDKNQDRVAAFDALFTTNSLQMLKILISHFPTSTQKSIAVYIKFMELQYTFSFFQSHPYACVAGPAQDNTFDTGTLCDELLPYCDTSTKKNLQQLKQMQQNMSQMQEMMQMMQTIKEMFPEGESPFGGEGEDILSGLSGMAGMDMSQLSELFQMFKQPE